jgi:hypothetical protein
MHKTPNVLPIYEAVVDVDDAIEMGQGPLGIRRMVGILGGEFQGSRLHGRVLPGGADRQLIRPDGVRILDALYEMETHDGVLLTVHNRVKVVERPGMSRQALSHLDIIAPEGNYGWLNDAVLVGTVDSMRPARQAVKISVFQLVAEL